MIKLDKITIEEPKEKYRIIFEDSFYNYNLRGTVETANDGSYVVYIYYNVNELFRKYFKTLEDCEVWLNICENSFTETAKEIYDEVTHCEFRTVKMHSRIERRYY